MTVEKAIVLKWERRPGWVHDSDARAFAQALARKRARFAFPNDFVELAKRLQRRLSDKHDKNTIEGMGLQALREIRVCATPSWDSVEVDVFFWFIRNDEDVDFDGTNWGSLLEKWLALVPQRQRFRSVRGMVVALDDMKATEYVESDPLDLDHLSSG